MLRRLATVGMWLGGAVLLLSLLVAMGAWAFSVEVQRIQPYDEIRRELTGEIGVEEGSPIRAVLFDRSVLIDREGEIPAIDASQHYPVQLRTVLYVAVVTAIVAFVALALFALVRRFAGRAPSAPGTAT